MASGNALPKLIQDPRYTDFVKRYAFNLPLFAIEVCGLNLTYQQVEVMKSVQPLGSRTSISSGHGTGKTASFGLIVLWHLTCYYNSVTAVIAPKVEQVCKQVFKEVALSINRMKKGNFAWVAEQVELNATDINIKGAKQYWHVLAKTAPKNEPENLAGLHADYLLVIADEASGIEDTHFGVLTGSLTDQRNRMVLASQPTRNTGFFYETHHKLSIPFGGAWNNITLNSELSPIVSLAFLKEKKLQYSKEQYDIKVRGLFPNKSDGFLLGRSEVEAVFGHNPLKGYQDWGYVIPIDVGGGDFRDDSVMTIARVWGFGLFGENARRVYIEDIPIMRDDQDTVNFARAVANKAANYNGATLAVDYGGLGVGFIHNLNDLGVPNVEKVKWGNLCFRKELKDSFYNLRAQAIVSLSRAIQEKRFGISPKVADRYGIRIINELTRIPYDYDNKARYQIMSKPDMKAKGIPSPDIADTFAFTFLENINYIAAETDYRAEMKDDWANKIAQELSGLDDYV
ncbi:DEAD/DEAH box helicase family protein [Rodentibacter pneumotropicus]|uniref:Terminase n=2 Tax=Rodentibacter pneumotropicus TaxID=758 RepID=A0A4S2QGR0_9PAST|nr:DEAD/DEAH box helicase family protein [Rodentibacter pneumotropicus]THA05531.1 hypothetical protein D3M77_09415 [Rodentibacter pneumotropicus]THA16333.1 hypothetical protein D3M76_03445 [Rodentibacter pneumotropicus]